MTETINLSDLKRAELDDLAVEKGITDPKAYSNADDLRVAVEAAIAGEPIPEPKAKASSSTVTLTEAPGNTRSVLIGDERFVLDTPVEAIGPECVKAVKKFTEEESGYEFKID